jgi:[acyl-carrier-protein] S-malonyltransferase
MPDRAAPVPPDGKTHDDNGRLHGLALLFPGQGAQHAGMGKRIAEMSQAARRIFEQADDVLNFKISKVCFEGSEEELEDTVNTQPAILTTSLAYLAFVRERLGEVGRKLRPSMMAGHSLGQFSAAIATNTLDFDDGLRLVMERGRVMGEYARARPGGMATILGMSDDDVRTLCSDASPEGVVSVAVTNGPGHTVISGDDGPLDKAMALARERGGRPLRLPIGVPGHSPLMHDAARELSRFISTLTFRDPNPPMVSNISARLLMTAEDVRQELSDQIWAAVEWARCVLAMINEGATSFVEVGPGQALSKLVKRISGEANVIGVEHASIEDLIRFVDAVPVPARSGAAG